MMKKKKKGTKEFKMAGPYTLQIPTENIDNMATTQEKNINSIDFFVVKFIHWVTDGKGAGPDMQIFELTGQGDNKKNRIQIDFSFFLAFFF